tara:strand:+ start:102 stop:521 length:420 start_codon:yes stop_codon:yes gene_type:complete
MKDYQVKQVYNSEEELDIFINGPFLSREEITEFVTQISIWADIEPPKIQCKQEYAVTDVSSGTADKIFLPIFAQNPWFICHEMTHVILDSWEHIGDDHHGPNFCNIYLYLLGWTVGDKTEQSLRELFYTNGVKIGSQLV